MYCVNGNSSWYSDCGPLFGGCPLLGVSVIGGSTVPTTITMENNHLYAKLLSTKFSGGSRVAILDNYSIRQRAFAKGREIRVLFCDSLIVAEF